MLSTNNFIIEKPTNTYKISQHKNGMYQAERINVFNDNDISTTTALKMIDIFDWIDSQENS